MSPWQRRDPGIGQQLKSRSRTRTGFTFAIGFVVVIWVVEFLNILSGGRLSYYGIHPLDPSSLWHIATAPLLHANFEHLIGNTIPAAIFCFIIGMGGKRVFWEVTLIVGLVAGIGTWLFGGVGTNHIGASGLIYGWLGYLIVRGVFNRDGKQILLGVALAFIYSGLFWGLLPTQPGVSWQGHLFGALGGIAAGAFITSDDPAALRARKEQKKLEKRRRGLNR
nr:rhomboid family intramembrane serine protease [Corynebacterium pacaense]